MDLNVSDTQSPQQQLQQQHQANDQQQSNQQQQQPQQQQQQQQQQQNQQPPYTIPGILHYLQYEWHRFEAERQEWEVEKAELSARIALLQGEKKSHENLKHDLIRRIKMLEYCLRMERAKYHKLKHGTDPPQIEGDNQNQQISDENSQKAQNDDSLINSNNNSSTVTYGRELLRHYLQEIGYTDNIIDLRSNRVRSLLGIVDNPSGNQQQPQNSQSTNQTSNNSSNNTNNNSNNSNDQKTNPNSMRISPREQAQAMNKKIQFAAELLSNNTNSKQPGDVGEAEASVLATFGFLYDHEGIKGSNQLDEEEEEISEDVVDAADRAASTSTTEYSYFDTDGSDDTAMRTFDLLKNEKTPTVPGDSSLVDSHKDINRVTTGDKTQPNVSANAKNWCPSPQKSDAVDIGELATLTTLGSETTYDDYRRKQWIAKYRLQSHYDCVRALKFSETDSLLVTASEDETIKLWHLSRPSSIIGKSRQSNLPPSINAISSYEGSTLDIEPLHTYRGHNSRILSVTICKNHIFSGAQNGELIMWRIISNPSAADQYDKFDSTLLVCRFVGHNDAVWSIETVDQTNSEPLLCSASADLTIKIWNTTGENKEPIGVINLPSSPTCIARIPLYNICHAGADIAVSFCDGKIRLYDIASCLDNTESNTQPTATFECDEPHRINSIVIHPTLSYMASADSHNDIKFWDLKTRKCKSTMVAHLDEVTSLACDPTGKYLLSASHDCSVRLWLFEERACIQEITSHRRKSDEGIFAVAFHPSLSHFATAGADGLAKVFV